MRDFLVLLLVLVVIAACQKQTSETPVAKVLVRVNGDPITEQDVLRRIRSARGDITREEVEPNTWMRLTEAAIDSEVLDRLLLQAAREEGMAVAPEIVAADLAKAREMLGDDGYQSMLKQRGATEAQFKGYLADRRLIARYREQVARQVDLSDADAETYFDGHPERFAEPERFRLHVLAYPSPEEADSAHARVQTGESFETVAVAHETAGGRTSRTRPMARNALPDGMREIVTASAAGDLVRYDAPDGSYLIKLLERVEGGERSFEEAKDDVKKYLYDIRGEKALANWYEKKARQASIEYTNHRGDARE